MRYRLKNGIEDVAYFSKILKTLLTECHYHCFETKEYRVHIQ